MSKTLFLISLLIITSSGLIFGQHAQRGELPKNDIKLKIGPVWYSGESKIHLVYGVTDNNQNQNYITEIHFNFGGNIICEKKELSAIFDFKDCPEIILPDSLNQLLPAAKPLINRKREGSRIQFTYKNNQPRILVFAIEKINLKPNNKSYKSYIKLKSECSEYLNLPILLSKFNVANVGELVERYIEDNLSSLSENELKELKVIFSYNGTTNSGEYKLDLVNQPDMLILRYDANSNEYLITDFEKNILKRIKRST